ncbi:MAG TPA: type II secretion system major pseudopilin GspG [Bacillota bacterium]|nr:type II secretion system major pseudopilin GspG [Bacillota bacterium]
MGAQRNQPKGSNNLLKIVAIILGVLFIVILIVPDIKRTEFSPRRVSLIQISAIGNLLSQYYTDTGYYPSTLEGLKALVKRPTGVSGAKWNGPYVTKSRFADGWGRELNYQCPGTHNPDSYDLWSNGADGKEGGTGKNADIGNW